VCFREDGGNSYYNDYFTKAREAAQTITATEEDDCMRLACQVSSALASAGAQTHELKNQLEVALWLTWHALSCTWCRRGPSSTAASALR
jgi:hypothetical protein